MVSISSSNDHSSLAKLSNQGFVHITKLDETNLKLRLTDQKNPQVVLLEYTSHDKSFSLQNTKDSSRYFVLVPAKTKNLMCNNCEDEVTTADEECASCKACFCHLCSNVLHRKKDKRDHERVRISPIGVAFTDRKIAADFNRIISTKRRESGNFSKMETKHDENHLKESEKQLIHIIKEVTKVLEEEDVYKNVVKFMYDNFYDPKVWDKPRDVPYLTEKIFCDILPKDSPTVRIFKSIHQGIIAHAKRKLLVATRLPVMVKDYKGQEGWKISIEIQPNTIQVIHKRREETLPVAPSNEQFYFDYEIVFTFSKNAEVLYAVNMKIFNLKFIEPVNEQFRIKIEKSLGHGNLHI